MARFARSVQNTSFSLFNVTVIKIAHDFSKQLLNRQMKKTKFLISAISAIIMLTSLIILSASASTASFPTFTLSSSSTQLHFALPVGTQFNGSISTTGPVRFFVSAPNGSVIVNLGLIDKTNAFSFIAQQTGNYSLNFENDLPDPVQVIFSYVTNPDISGGSNSGGIPLIYLPIFIIIAVFGSILIIFLSATETKIRLHPVIMRLQIKTRLLLINRTLQTQQMRLCDDSSNPHGLKASFSFLLRALKHFQKLLSGFLNIILVVKMEKEYNVGFAVKLTIKPKLTKLVMNGFVSC